VWIGGRTSSSVDRGRPADAGEIASAPEVMHNHRWAVVPAEIYVF
jgi:hypothetical protein